MYSVRCSLGLLALPAVAALLLSALATPLGAQSPPAAHHPGQWTKADPWPGRTRFDNSVHAVHMALLRGDTLFGRPHSQVMAWGIWAPGSSDGGLWAWNPTTDDPDRAGSNLSPLLCPAPPYNVFCSGHSPVPDGSGDLLIVGGTQRGHTGENLSARFSASARRWSVADLGDRRWYANGTPLADGRVLATAGWAYDHMVVLGGRRSDGARESDLRRYAITNEGHWDPALSGSAPAWPASRESHSVAEQENGPNYLFGGRDGAGTRNDVWQLFPRDTDQEQSYRWKQLFPTAPSQGPPAGRWRHVAVLAGLGRDSLATMFVHGGESRNGSRVTRGDLWKLEWQPGQAGGQWRWIDLTGSVTGAVPSARSGHTAVWDPKNQRMILFGGQNHDGSITDANVYLLEFPGGRPTWRIATRPPGLPAPTARSRHAMTVDLTAETATGVVFGGRKSDGRLTNELWEFTVSAAGQVRWSLRSPGASSPEPRAGASVVFYALYPQTYVVVGGELENGALDSSVWEFGWDTVQWSRRPAHRSAVTGHTAFFEHRPLTTLRPAVFDPRTNRWSPFGDRKLRQSYHMIFLASDGLLYSPGPNFAGRDSTWRFDPRSGAWSLYATNATEPLDATISGILYRPDRMMKCGGLGHHEAGSATYSLQTGLTGSPSWRSSVNPMALTRGDHILNMLPTGDVIVTGGQGMRDNDNADPEDDMPRKRPEIWDPGYTTPTQPGKSGYWYGAGAGNPLVPEPVTRGHHSSAILLPDGRVLSGGGWDRHPDRVKHSVDQFSPPFLFRPGGARAPRPRLQGAQEHITWGRPFEVSCPDRVVAACLIRPGSTTHALNQNSRYVPLTVAAQAAGDHRVTLLAPPNANHAPPGDYLLFVLRDDNGRRVPSLARWVNLGSAQTTYATWDTLPPQPIRDLKVVEVTPTSHTLRWTAPADAGAGSSGRATRYELRYRIGSSMPTLESFFMHGSSVSLSLLPAAPGTVQNVTLPTLAAGQTHYFCIISRDGAGSDRNWSALSNEARTPAASAAALLLDVRTAAGWEIENSILGRSLVKDAYRLRRAPAVADGRVRLRMRQGKLDQTALGQVRLVAVDHAPESRIWALGDRLAQGTRVAAQTVKTSRGVDVTPLVNGSGAGFEGRPGDTLLVTFAQAGAAGGWLLLEDGGPCPPDCDPQGVADAGPASVTGLDAAATGSSGIVIEREEAPGQWRKVATRYPREYSDEVVLEGLGKEPVRLVFAGRHRVRFVGQASITSGTWSERELPRLVSYTPQDTTGGGPGDLSPGDTLNLEFAWAPVPSGRSRTLLFYANGATTSTPTTPPEPAGPARFAILPVRPNPFAGSTTLRFDLPASRHVRLEVLDPMGRRVRTLADRVLAAGPHSIEWDGRNEAGGSTGPGIYFFRLEAGEFRASGRMARVR